MHMSFGKILIAVDDGLLAARAADVGAELARDLHAQLALVSVVDASAANAVAAEAPAYELLAEARANGKKLIQTLRAKPGPDPEALEFMPEALPAKRS